ncbi:MULTISPECIES: restriction endonuclease subunit S [Burkholderia cepacia complex]|uniref:restriction endonuclease subunit S n=1 Tax=Burkholderia cepacia complex TaxID=87882 RepID=UPI0009B512B0|nr:MULTISPECIES: restriction endonuclease subunit S [Burkholderia cepacia complex]
MVTHLSALAQVQTAVTLRSQVPQEDPRGNARALAIRDLVAGQPLRWDDLPRVTIHDKHLAHCLQPGDIVIPSRGDYYKAWLFEGAEEPVFPLGQLNIIRPGNGLDARYLVWYLNQKSTQAKISLLLTGTSIKAFTKTALLALQVDAPPLSKQQQIAELDHTTQQIVAIRHRLSELDKNEIAYLTQKILHNGNDHA